METARTQRFTDRRVVVTGAAGGLGQVVAELFRAEGARVLGTDIVPADDIVPCDLADDAQRAVFVADALVELGGLDVLCNVAGIQQFAALGSINAADLRHHFDVNALAPLLLAQDFSGALIASRGNVVSVASISGVMAQPYNVQYCASKAALVVGMRAISIELGKHGVRVNCVSPGGIDTPLIAAAAAGLPEDADWNLVGRSMSVMPGFMPPAEVAENLLYLASDAASSVTGANLVVDRGVVW